jgi:hypothetical protein
MLRGCLLHKQTLFFAPVPGEAFHKRRGLMYAHSVSLLTTSGDSSSEDLRIRQPLKNELVVAQPIDFSSSAFYPGELSCP